MLSVFSNIAMHRVLYLFIELLGEKKYLQAKYKVLPAAFVHLISCFQ